MQYYNQPAMGGGMGMDPRMMPGMGGMPGGMPGMPNGMPGMMQPGMMGVGGMGAMGGGMVMPGMYPTYGQAYRQLGYDYQLPESTYKPEGSWGAWELARARYSNERLERPFLENIISTLTNYFTNRHLSEEAAREAHRRIYFRGEGEDAGNKTLGGAAAYQAFLIWDRDHHSAYHSYPSQENRERLVGLAVAELFALWDRVEPRSSRAQVEEASQYAAATAKYLFDRHYELQSNRGPYGSRYGNGYGADDESEGGESEGRHMRRRSTFGVGQPHPPNYYDQHHVPHPHHTSPPFASTLHPPRPPHPHQPPHHSHQGNISGCPHPQTAYQLMNPYAANGGPGYGPMNSMGGGMGMGGMNPMMGGGMMGQGMAMPGMGSMGMPGTMANMNMGGWPMGQGMGAGMMPGMGGGMMPGMGMGGMGGGMGGTGLNGMGGMPMGGMLGGMQGGVPMAPGGLANPMNEAQAAPGMHPYHYGAQSGVAYGNQPIDQMGHPTFPGGPGRSWYAYGQPRY